MRTLLTAALTLGGCTVTRWYLNSENRTPEEYAGGHIRLTALWNERGAFGWKIPKKTLFLLSGGVLGVLWLRRKDAPVSAGLALGGGASNLLERLRHGRVYDYVRFPKAPGCWKQYVFNLADFAIFAGTVGWLLRKRKT